jgi:DNA-directed RNA polymerase specialized sigma subunit
MKRFWDKVTVGGKDECWEWQASCNQHGYGYFGKDNKIKKAHRVAWELTHGPIPEGDHHGTMVVRHVCDNRRCCNPQHLRLGTQRENVEDMMSKGRNNQPSGEAQGSCKLTDIQCRAIINFHRLQMTQKWIAKRFGVSQGHVSHIIIGRTRKYLQKEGNHA